MRTNLVGWFAETRFLELMTSDQRGFEIYWTCKTAAAFRVKGAECREQDVGSGGLGFRVQDAGCGVSGSRFRDYSRDGMHRFRRVLVRKDTSALENCARRGGTASFLLLVFFGTGHFRDVLLGRTGQDTDGMVVWCTEVPRS